MSITTALTAARRGTVFLSIVCFAISYIALADLAQIAGQGPEAFLWPVMIDGTIVVGTVAVVAVGGDRATWSLLVAAAVVSIAGNGTHAWITQGSWIAVGVALTSPVFLLWTTHVTVELGRRADTSQKAVPNKRGAALELLAEGGLSMREIARRVGTDDRNVRRWRDEHVTKQTTTETTPTDCHPELVGTSS